MKREKEAALMPATWARQELGKMAKKLNTEKKKNEELPTMAVSVRWLTVRDGEK
jgi:hypothetical protein